MRPNSIARSLAIGNPADGDLAIATARASGGAIHAVPEDEIGAEHGAARRDRRHLRRDARPASRSGRCARPSARGEIGESDRVVVLVTGTGLKTPQAVEAEATGALVEIDADLDALLDELGVTA